MKYALDRNGPAWQKHNFTAPFFQFNNKTKRVEKELSSSCNIDKFSVLYFNLVSEVTT